MFHPFRDHRRHELLQEPFPAAWEAIVSRNVAHFALLDESEKRALRGMVQVFVAEKDWAGCGGLELNDEIRVTVAAQACLLQLGLEHDYYRNVETILVYPSTVVPPERRPGFFEVALQPVSTGQPLLGEAHLQGPVILVWDAVLGHARHPEAGHNVVYHEFAHKLDMLDGTADGTPPLANREEMSEWVEIFSRDYLRLRRQAEQGEKTFIDAYGATNEAEFFAVATEEFFDRPQALIDHAPDLYRLLRDYYRQDPLARLHRQSQQERP